MIDLLRYNDIHGWRRHVRLPGTPDFCWCKKRVVLFIDGCFWHGCPKCYKTPKSNVAFWKEKVIANKKRDKLVNKTLKKLDWKVLRIWECELGKNMVKINKIKKILDSCV